MFRWFTIGLIFLLIGCGRTESYRLEGLSELDAESYALISDAIDSLNDRVGRTLFSEDNEGYPIFLEPAEDMGGELVLGSATTEFSKCTIQILCTLIDHSNEDLLASVVWHEIGHCLGLHHVDEPNDLMYPQSKPFSQYSDDMIDHFINQLLSSVKIN